jgi:small subunit ribosomal protein S17
MADETPNTEAEKPKRTRRKAGPAATPESPAETPAAQAEPAETVAEAEPEPEAVDVAAEAEPEPAAAPAAGRATPPPAPSRPKRAEKPVAKPKAVRPKPAERKPIVRLEKPEHERGRRQERRGVVVSSAMDKTIVVKVEAIKAHPRYKKVVRRSVKFHAHDEGNLASVGDVVRIVETRPVSKTKRWRLAEVVEVAR